MPKSPKQPARNAWEVDFVNVSLDKLQKEQLKKWDTTGEVTSDTITRLVSDGYKLSISADKAHDCVGAYLTEPANSDGSRKRCLSSRGPDFFGALKALAYKHVIVLEGDWGDKAEHGEALDQWG
jgi:hypothetical protein